MPASFLRAFPASGPVSPSRARAAELLAPTGIALLGITCGSGIAVGGLNGLYLCVSLIGCVFVLVDFRIGVVLLILLMPISASSIFPHAMLGITGLNPVNLLLMGTLGSGLLRGLSEGGIGRLLPRPLLWLYVLPILGAGLLGARHVGDIAPGFAIYGLIEFDNAAGYFRDMVVKPLFMVLFALLVGAAVARSQRPERFLAPMLISIWIMGALVIVFVALSGVGLSQLARSTSRGFLSKLGLHANDLGRLYAVAYALLLFTWTASKAPVVRLMLLASMAMVVIALVLTFSRGAFVGFVVVNAVFLLWQRNAKTLALLLVLAPIALLALPDAVYDRVTTGFGGGADEISAGRIEGIWLPQVPEILRSPIYGNGLGSILWSQIMRDGDGVVYPAVTHPHNAYLQALEDMGIAGLIVLCAYFAGVWRGFRALSADPSLSPTLRGFFLGAAAGLVSLLAGAVTDGSLVPRPEQSFLWLAIGMMYGQYSANRALEDSLRRGCCR
jgi:O-antigen ligase